MSYISRIRRQDELNTEHKIHTTEDSYMCSKLLDDTDFKILLDMRVSKSFVTNILSKLSIITFFTYVCIMEKYFHRQWPVCWCTVCYSCCD